MTSQQRIVVNTAAQYIRTIINVCLSLYSTRLILASLGHFDFGIYSVVAGVVAMLSFMTNALVVTTQRYLSYHYGRGDKAALSAVFGNSMLLHVLIALSVLILLGALSYPVLFSVLKIEEGRMTAAIAVYISAMIMLVLTFLTAPFRALFIARENIVYISVVDILDGVFRLLIAICLTFIVSYDRLITYSILLIGISLFNLLACGIYALRHFEECHIPRWREWNRLHVSEMGGFAGWTVYSTGCIIARTQGIAVLLNRYFVSAVNAAYGLALQVNGATAFIAQAIANSMSPQIVKAAGQDQQQKVLSLSEKASKYSVLLFSLVAIPLIAEMEVVLRIWLGEYPAYTVEFCRFILIACICDQMTMGLTLANQATGKIKYYSLLINSVKLLTLPAAWLCLYLGMNAMAAMWCYLLFEVLCAVIRLPYIKVAQGLSISHYVRTVILRVLIPIAAASLLCAAVIRNVHSDYRIIITIIGAVMVYVVCSYLFALDRDEKKALQHMAVYILSAIIPRGKVIVFQSSPAYSDNPYALYKYLLKESRFRDYTFVWSVDGGKNNPVASKIIAENPSAVTPTGCISMWWYLLRATFMIYSHTFYDDYDFFNKRKRINLWHGTGFKKVGIDNGERPVKTDYLVTTNRVWQTYLAHSFALPKGHVWVTGEPRTDMLFEPTDFFANHHINTAAYTSVGIWMPTFRRHILLDTIEGNYKESEIAGFSMGDLSELDTYLKQINGLLLIKLHMYDKLQELTFPAFSNIIIIKPAEFHEQLYPLIGACDYLITDYSSVSFDYDILNRPMAFVLNDIKQYVDYRGFYEIDIEHLLPGKLIETLDDLKAFIGHPEQYKVDSGNHFNDYKDAHVCQRVTDHLIELL